MPWFGYVSPRGLISKASLFLKGSFASVLLNILPLMWLSISLMGSALSMIDALCYGKACVVMETAFCVEALLQSGIRQTAKSSLPVEQGWNIDIAISFEGYESHYG